MRRFGVAVSFMLSSALLSSCIRLAGPIPTDAEIVEAALGYAALVRTNPAPYRTTRHADRPLVNVWADPTAAAIYRGLTLEETGSAVFPEGSLLVKETFLADGQRVLAIRYKVPAVWDPTHGNWWYGLVDLTGAPVNGSVLGKNPDCSTCHAEVARQDHTFGLPRAMK